MRKFYLFLFVCFYLSNGAQDDSLNTRPKYRRGMMYEVITTQNTVKGVLIRETHDAVVIEDKKDHHIYEILKTTIVAMKPLSDRKVYHDAFLSENYHAHTYLFSSSSMLNTESRSYVNYQWLLLENINYSLNENWTITMNTLFFYPASIGVKCSYEIAPNLYLGGNVFVMGNISDRLMPSAFFLGYGALARLTKGNTNNNFSISAGTVGFNLYMLNQNQNQKVILNVPFANFSYANRFHQRWAVCAEGWYIPGVNIGLGGAGVKFLKSESTSWTFGCFSNIKVANNQIVPDLKTVPIPYLGYTMNF